MKIGIREPSPKKSLAARLSWIRFLQNTFGLKAPRGWGWLTDPRRALYNRIYDRLTVSFWSILRRMMS